MSLIRIHTGFLLQSPIMREGVTFKSGISPLPTPGLHAVGVFFELSTYNVVLRREENGKLKFVD